MLAGLSFVLHIARPPLSMSTKLWGVQPCTQINQPHRHGRCMQAETHRSQLAIFNIVHPELDRGGFSPSSAWVNLLTIFNLVKRPCTLAPRYLVAPFISLWPSAVDVNPVTEVPRIPEPGLGLLHLHQLKPSQPSALASLCLD